MSSKSSSRPKHGRKSTGSDDGHDGIASVYAKKLHAAEAALKRDIQGMEAELAREEAIYAAAMERIVSVRRQSAIWRSERMSQWDATRRELMAQQQDAELAAELARVRMKHPHVTRATDRQTRVRERLKKRTAELKQAEAERAAKQQPEIIVEPDICYVSDLDDEFMESLDASSQMSSDSDDRVSLASADSISDIESDHNIPMSPIGENIEVEQGDESDDDLEVDGLSNHSDYVTDDASHTPTSSTLDREAFESRVREQAELERQARARAEVEQAEAERARLRREREMRAKQEEARREQERLRWEQQERSKREQQERARQDYEQQQRRAAEEHRRSQSRRSLDPVTSDSAAWARYTAQWNKLQAMDMPGRKNSDAILFFSNIPWPTVRAPRGPDDITKEAVASLVLSPSHSQEKSAKARLRDLLLVWHPDKFVGRWMGYVVPADQPDVTEGVAAVARIANDLLKERNSR